MKDAQSAAEDPLGRDEVAQLACCQHERGQGDGVGVDRPRTLCKRARSKELIGVSLGSLVAQARRRRRDVPVAPIDRSDEMSGIPSTTAEAE